MIAHSEASPRQPHRPLAEEPEVVDEDLVDDPDVALPHELPQQRDDEARHDPRRQHQRADQLLAADRAVEQHRHREPAGERPADGDEGVDGGVLHGAEEARPQRAVGVEEDRAVVRDARRGRVEQQREGEGVELLEAQVDPADRRQAVHQHHEQRGRGDQRPGEAPPRRRRSHPAPPSRHRAGEEPRLVTALDHGRRAHAQETRGSARSLGQQRVGLLLGALQLLLDVGVADGAAAGLLEDVGEAGLVGLLDRSPLRDRGVRAALLDRLEEAAVVGVGLAGEPSAARSARGTSPASPRSRPGSGPGTGTS